MGQPAQKVQSSRNYKEYQGSKADAIDRLKKAEARGKLSEAAEVLLRQAEAEIAVRGVLYKPEDVKDAFQEFEDLALS